jgi:hypothetical protein
MSRSDDFSRGNVESALPRVVPICKVTNEGEQRVAKSLVGFLSGTTHLSQLAARHLLESLWAKRIAWVGQQQGKQNSTTRRKRPTRPPQVQRTWVTMPNRFFPSRLATYLGNRKIHLGEALAFSRYHSSRLNSV